jgi:transcriptional regulator with XRE-family HTH domain
MVNFSELIHARREELGLSLRELEKRLKEQGVQLSKTFLIFLEKDRKKPTFEVAYALARAMDINVERALEAAYRARVDFDKNKNRETLAEFIENNELKGIDIKKITG